ncbi:hypothetical protein POV27_05575 [Aureisphaera galaxeae]|uniref:hypothetical protein n=1 Tax=Aureisphaera galaxeae TaxID=1538023 RepID=UPI0023503238|nr:hypothetical protein [Aureisphaera galaxeae]MDC8003510.1 hypothetical protein [Aureisphaera galaxeae]
MTNPFKKLIRNEELPEFLKQKVMDDLEFIKLSMEFADLFAIKYPETINSILKTTRNNPNNQ